MQLRDHVEAVETTGKVSLQLEATDVDRRRPTWKIWSNCCSRHDSGGWQWAACFVGICFLHVRIALIFIHQGLEGQSQSQSHWL